MQAAAFPFTKDVRATVALFYTAGFGLVLVAVEPWEAARRFAAEAIILALWLGIADRLLRVVPIVDSPVKRPALELALGLAGLVVSAVGAAGHFLGIRWLRLLVIADLPPLAVFVGLRYDRRAIGPARAPRRVWLAVAAIVAVNVTVGVVVGQVLPPGELPPPPAPTWPKSCVVR